MNFRLNEEQRQLQHAIRRIVGDPDRHRQRRAVVDGAANYDTTLWCELCEFGTFGIVVPEDLGGSGLKLVELALVAEVLGAAGAPVPFLGQALATIAVLHGGDDDQRARWLPGLASGRISATVALSEDADSWGPADWRIAAADEHITGRKINVPSCEHPYLLIVGLEGGGLGVVESTAPGLQINAMDGIDLTRPLSSVEFDRTPVVVLTHGQAAARRMMDAACVLLAADAFGGASRLLEMTRDYALTRETFGAVLAERQAIKHQLANVALEVEPTRGLFWFAAYAFDDWTERASEAALLAKALTSEVYLESARMCTELHGGIGFTWEFDAHIWLKRAMFDFAWGATPDHLFGRAADLAEW